MKAGNTSSKDENAPSGESSRWIHEMEHRRISTRSRAITVGYLRAPKESFLSNITITNNFLEALSGYVRVVPIPTDLRKMDLRKIKALNIDFLLIDFSNLGIKPFLLREIQNIHIPFILILHTIYFWFFDLALTVPLIRQEDVLIAPSRYSKESFLRISPKQAVHHIPYCLDVAKIQSGLRKAKKGGRKTIGFMGRLTEEKGLGNLIDCMPDLVDRVGEVHLNIIGPLAGNSPSDHPKSLYVKNLGKKIRRLKLEENIHFLGLQLGPQKYRTLSSLDLFVLPTVAREENLPVSVLEALSSGVPVITTDWSGTREVIRNGQNGYLLQSTFSKEGKLVFDAGELVDLVVKTLNEPERALKMKRGAKKSALRYDYRKIVPKFLDVLNHHAGPKRGQQGNWEEIKDRRITDFRDLYRRETLFFLGFFALADKTLKEICEGYERKGINPLSKRRISHEKDLTLSTQLFTKVDKELFRYLCID